MFWFMAAVLAVVLVAVGRLRLLQRLHLAAVAVVEVEEQNYGYLP
jgi:hypothetical protein